MRGTVNGSTADPLLTARCAGSTAVRCEVCPRAVERHCERWAFLLAHWFVCLFVCVRPHSVVGAPRGCTGYRPARAQLSRMECPHTCHAVPYCGKRTTGRLYCIPYAAPLDTVQSSASNSVEGSGHVGHGVLQRVVSCCKMHCRNYSHLPRPRFQVDMLRVDRRKPVPATVNRLPCHPHSAEYSRVRCRAKPRHSAAQKCSAAHLTLVQCGRSAPLQQRSAGQSFHATQSNSSTVLCSALFRQVSGVLRSVGHSECAAIHFTAAGGLKPVEQYTHLLW